MAWHQWSDKPLSGQMMALKIDAYMRHSLSFNELIALDQIGWPVRNLTNCSQYHYFMSTTNADDLLTNVTIYIFVLSIWEKPNTPEYDGTITNYYIFVLGYIYIICRYISLCSLWQVDFTKAIKGTFFVFINHISLPDQFVTDQHHDLPEGHACTHLLPSGLARSYQHWYNSLTPGRCGSNFIIMIFKLILWNDILNISCKVVIRRMPQKSVHDKSILVQVMDWCCQVVSYYLS